MDAWQEMDDWCKKRLTPLRDSMAQHVMSGKDMADPSYRKQFGEAWALHRMRSYIHGARNATPEAP